MSRFLFLGAIALFSSVAAGSVTASAATLEPIGTYSRPVFVTSEPPDPDRVLVVEQGGRIQLTDDGTTSLFLNISSLITPGGEEGLLSMAPAPDYATSKRFFVFYVDTSGNLQIDEYTASSIPVDTATRRPVLSVPHTTASNHNGGQLQFGPDGNLYISTGDGGNTPELAQDTSVLLGKILRIDPDRTMTAPYSVPADNPFVGVAGADEIWSYGLRNPFRFSFDRSTGAILIGDVGAGSREEVDYEPQPNAGRADNYGWYCREGFAPGNGSCSGGSGFTDPIHDYAHVGGNCSITGGFVSRDTGVPELAGRYLYADHCVGQIRSLIPGLPLATDDRSEGLSVANPSSFGQDSCGRIYVASLGGAVSRIAGSSPTDCEPPQPPAGLTTDPPSPAADTTPKVKGSAQADATQIEIYKSAGCTGVATSGPRSEFVDAGIELTVPADLTTSFAAKAVDAVGNRSACSSSIDYTHASAPQPDAAPKPVGDPDPGLPGPFLADVDPPELELTAPDKQGLGRDRKLVCRVRPDEESDVVARLAILSRSEGVLLRLGERELHAGVGEKVKLSWKLDEGEARSLRRVLANDPVIARFRARAKDLAGNRSERREAISAL